jgi:hypothetical protein
MEEARGSKDLGLFVFHALGPISGANTRSPNSEAMGSPRCLPIISPLGMDSINLEV